MARLTLTRRVERLEEDAARAVNTQTDLEQFRGEVRAEFAWVHAEFDRVQAQFDDVRAEFAWVRAEFVAVRAEIREGDEETRRQMRVLHEDVLGRIAIMGEGIDDLRARVAILEDLVPRVAAIEAGIADIRGAVMTIAHALADRR